MVCRPMVVNLARFLLCDVTCLPQSGAEFVPCGGTCKSPRRNWPPAPIFTAITSVASNAENVT